MDDGVGKRVLARARELGRRGPEALAPLPDVEELAKEDKEERVRILESLRVDLYALSSIVADTTVQRAWRERAEYPPYGLVWSGYSDFRQAAADPTVLGEGDIGDFYRLGKAYVDTVVFHLHRQFADYTDSPDGWLVDRLEALLGLFRVKSPPATRARMQDAMAFIYGGLHFGAGVSVQLVEAMSRLLDTKGVGPREKVEIITRSTRPAFTLAALNVDTVVIGFQRLQGRQQVSKTADGRLSMVSWMDETKLVVQRSGKAPARIELASDALRGTGPQARPLEEAPTTFSTHGCPARISPSGGASAIATLWTWSVSLAAATGLLDPPSR